MTSRVSQNGMREATDFTGVAEFLSADVAPAGPADLPESVATADLPDDDGPTEESPAPIFSDEPVSTAPTPNRSPAGFALWDEPSPPRKRKLPPKALAAGCAGALLLLMPLVFRHRSHETQGEAPTLAEDLIVSEHDLRNRVEVSADDFRPHKASAAEPSAAGDESDAMTLAERRKQRALDPEDLVALRSGSRRAADHDDGKGVSDPSAGAYERPYVYFDPSVAPSASHNSAPPQLAPAGTVVSAVLVSPIDLRGSSTTIIAQADADGAIPKGARFVGSATSDGDARLSLRFDRLILTDGREARIQGEAQDTNGAFGVEGSVSADGNRVAGIARDVATDTASDAAAETVDALTGGIAGRLLRRAVDRSTRGRGVATEITQRVALPAGARFHIFLHQAVTFRS